MYTAHWALTMINFLVGFQCGVALCLVVYILLCHLAAWIAGQMRREFWLDTRVAKWKLGRWEE
jgi:hypothetical protein